MLNKPDWPGDDEGTVLTMINQNSDRGGHYGSLPTHDPHSKNGAPSENTVRRPSSTFASFGQTQELYRKEIDWVVVSKTGRVLMIASFLALIIALGLIIGASLSASVSLFVLAACVLTVYARQLFILFLISVAGVSTIRSAYYKRRKIQLLLSLCANLVAFLVLGGALYVTICRLAKSNNSEVNPKGFLITSAIALPFIAILCGLLSMAKKLEDQHSTSKSKSSSKSKSPQHKAAMVSGFSRFSKERGLILRRTLNRISIRSNHYFSLVLLLQALVAFLCALIVYFKHSTTMIADPILAIIFTPLALIMAVSVSWEVIGILTEGILQGVDFGEIAEALINIEGVTAVRHLRIWSMKTDEVSLSVQIAIDDQANFDAVLRSANDLLKTKYDIYQYKIDSTIEGTMDEDIDI